MARNEAPEAVRRARPSEEADPVRIRTCGAYSLKALDWGGRCPSLRPEHLSARQVNLGLGCSVSITHLCQVGTKRSYFEGHVELDVVARTSVMFETDLAPLHSGRYGRHSPPVDRFVVAERWPAAARRKLLRTIT